MGEIFTKAGTFVAIILLGYLLRRIGFFKESDFNVFSRLVLKVTLTATIIYSFSGRELDYSMFMLTGIGFGFGVFLLVLSVLTWKRKGPAAQAFAIVNQSGCNIGSFAMAFAQGFLGPVGMMAVSLFDVGNAVIVLGSSFTIAQMIREGRDSFSAKRMVKGFVSSVPLMTYISMTILSALRIQLPGPVVHLAGTIANANAFLAMFMIGIGFRLEGKRSQLGMLVRMLGTRYTVAVAVAAVSFLLLPLPLEYRQALVIAVLSPIPAVAPAYTEELGGDTGLSCVLNSCSIIISILLITASCFLIL